MLLSLFLRLCAYCRGSRRYHRGSLGREPVNWASTMMNHSPHWSAGGVKGCVKYLYKCLSSTLFIQRLRRRDTFGGFARGLCTSSARTDPDPQTRDRLRQKSVQLYWGSDGHQICPNALYIDWTQQIYHAFLILDYFIKSVPTMFTGIINQLSVSKATTWSTLENCTTGLTEWLSLMFIFHQS